MQHVCGHTGNLGNECADHAAALGTFGFVSNKNLSTRLFRYNFDTSACFGSCSKIRKRNVTIVFNYRYPQFNFRMPHFYGLGHLWEIS